MDDLGVPLFLETIIFGNTHIPDKTTSWTIPSKRSKLHGGGWDVKGTNRSVDLYQINFVETLVPLNEALLLKTWVVFVGLCEGKCI